MSSVGILVEFLNCQSDIDISRTGEDSLPMYARADSLSPSRSWESGSFSGCDFFNNVDTPTATPTDTSVDDTTNTPANNPTNTTADDTTYMPVNTPTDATTESTGTPADDSPVTPTDTPVNPADTDSGTVDDEGLSAWKISLIAAVAVVAVAVVVLIFLKRRRLKDLSQDEKAQTPNVWSIHRF